MITQPNPHIEARPATPDVQNRHPLHLPGRLHLRSATKDSRAIDTHIPNIALAGLHLLLGYLIELGETLAGLGLITAGMVALLRPLAGRYLRGTSATVFMYRDRLLGRLALFAAIGAGLLGVSYFFLDGLPAPWFIPSIAFGGSINQGIFLAVASVILVVSQLMQRQQSR